MEEKYKGRVRQYGIATPRWYVTIYENDGICWQYDFPSEEEAMMRLKERMKSLGVTYEDSEI